LLENAHNTLHELQLALRVRTADAEYRLAVAAGLSVRDALDASALRVRAATRAAAAPAGSR